MKGDFVFSFDGWFKQLTNLVFMAPMFVFFLYLTVKFLSIGINLSPSLPGESAAAAHVFMDVLFPFMLVFALLNQGRKIVKQMSGEFGAAMSKAVGSLAGLAIGGAIGGAAFAGRKAIGTAAGSFVRSEAGKRAASKSALGRLAFRGAQGLEKSSFDFRSSKAFNAIQQGANLTETKMIDFGKARGQGGAAKTRQQALKLRKDFAQTLKKDMDQDRAHQDALREKTEAQMRQTEVEEGLSDSQNIYDNHPVTVAARELSEAARELKLAAEEEKKVIQELEKLEGDIETQAPGFAKIQEDLGSDDPEVVASAEKRLADLNKNSSADTQAQLRKHRELTGRRQLARQRVVEAEVREKKAQDTAERTYNVGPDGVLHAVDALDEERLRKAEQHIADAKKAQQDVAIAERKVRAAQDAINNFNREVRANYARNLENKYVSKVGIANYEAASNIRRDSLFSGKKDIKNEIKELEKRMEKLKSEEKLYASKDTGEADTEDTLELPDITESADEVTKRREQLEQTGRGGEKVALEKSSDSDSDEA